METKKRVAVVGAGIAGLTAGYELQRAGFDVVVYEKETVLGGRMSTRVTDGLEFNPGATFLSENYYQLKAYSDELGVPWTAMQEGSSHRVLRGDSAHPFRLSGPLDLFRLSVISIRARLRLLFWIIKLKLRPIHGNFFDLSTLGSTERRDAAQFLKSEVSEEVLDYIADPFMGALHFHRSNDFSARALLVLLKMMLGNKDFSSRYPEGGVQAIPNALAARLYVERGVEVSSIKSEVAHVTVKVSGRKEVFDAVVLAAPAPALLPMLLEPTESQRKLLASVRYASTVTISFRVPVDFFRDMTHCIYVPFVKHSFISSCIFEGRKGQGLTADGETLFNVYLHADAAEAILGETDQAIIDRVLKELPAVCPEFGERRSEISFNAIARWPLAMPKFDELLISAVNEFMGTGQGEGGIYLAGDYLNSPWTEGAAQSGKRAAAFIANDFGKVLPSGPKEQPPRR